MKYYAVKNGRKKGIFLTWDECKESVDGYPSATFKSFKTKEDAEAYLGLRTAAKTKPKVEVQEAVTETVAEAEAAEPAKESVHTNNNKKTAVAYVDGSYNKTANIYGSGVVFMYDEKIEKIAKTGADPVMLKMWNVAGEVEASMIAIQKAIDMGFGKIIIYHDYTGIAGWVNGTVVNGKQTKPWKANEDGAIRYKEFGLKAKEKIEIEFKKVAAHTGVEYNELADQLAKTAANIDI